MSQNLQVTVALNFDASIIAGITKKSTENGYRRDLHAYLLFAQTKDAALNPATLARWRAYLVNETDYSPTYINRKISAIHAIMAEAAQQAYISHELALHFKQVRGVKVEALEARRKKHARTRISAEDMRRLCESPNPETLLGLRDQAMLHTLASSGVRVSELANLTQEHLLQETSDGPYYFALVKGKNDKKYRKAPLSAEAYQAIQRWLSTRTVASPIIFTRFRNTFVEGKPVLRETTEGMSGCAIWKLVKKYAKESELEHIKPHDFRRFMVTRLIKRKGLSAANKAAGHKNIATTILYDLGELEPGLTDGSY